ncbi:MAG TPA: hypothetical protein VGD57_08555 [Candidatus Dormibacteraeota bacterium]
MGGEIETWDLWLPGPGASGLSFARARIDATDSRDQLLVHAAPNRLQVTVRDESGATIASGNDLERRMPGPMSRLLRNGPVVSLEDGWPTAADIGRVVILPGGEAGILKAWWHAEDRKEWRWQLEFYNQIRDKKR